MYRVGQLVQKYEKSLSLRPVAGAFDLSKPIKIAEASRPGLALSGYLKGYVPKRILVFGKEEIDYLADLNSHERHERLEPLMTPFTPCAFIPNRPKPLPEMVALAKAKEIPLFRTDLSTMALLNKLTLILNDEFAPSSFCHGTLVEVFGLGVLIQGSSSVGKSETALGLLERRHRLVADDIIKVKRREGFLEGEGTELTRHIMEIRGIGIINIAHLYGAVCVRESKNIDIVVALEEWDDDHSYERVGLEEKSCDILNTHIPFYVLPVKPGRDVVLLLETIVLNHRLKQMGLNSAKEFTSKLRQAISEKKRT